MQLYRFMVMWHVCHAQDDATQDTCSWRERWKTFLVSPSSQTMLYTCTCSYLWIFYRIIVTYYLYLEYFVERLVNKWFKQSQSQICVCLCLGETFARAPKRFTNVSGLARLAPESRSVPRNKITLNKNGFGNRQSQLRNAAGQTRCLVWLLNVPLIVNQGQGYSMP